jgi:CheY-like chemotaxis protein
MGRPGKKILIVDDELMLRKVLRRFLLHEGYITFEAGGAATALRLFREEQPFHALLCDVYLGVDSGWKLAKQIYIEQPTLRVVMLTGAFIPRLPALPFHHTVLLKPFDQEELIQAIENAEGKDDGLGNK